MKLKLVYNPKTPTPFINQFIIIFRETESLLPGLIISGKQSGDISSLARFNKGYKFLLTCIDVFSKFGWVVSLKNKTGESLVNGFQSILDTGRLTKELNFSIVIFKAYLKKIASISSPQAVN